MTLINYPKITVRYLFFEGIINPCTEGNNIAFICSIKIMIRDKNDKLEFDGFQLYLLENKKITYVNAACTLQKFQALNTFSH